MSKELTRNQIDELKLIDDPYKRKTIVQGIGYDIWAETKNGTMEMATGSGKTRVGLMAAHECLQSNPNAAIYIVVPTETLRDDDWPSEMIEAGYEYMITHPGVTRICYASLHKERPISDVDLLICDEVHHLTPLSAKFLVAGDWKVHSVLGLTATLPQIDLIYGLDNDKRLMLDELCPSVFKVPIEVCVELELVSDFDIYLMYFELDKTDHYIDRGANRAKFTEEQEYKRLTKQVAKAMRSKNENFKFMSIQQRVEFLSNLRSKEILAKEIMDQIIPGNRTIIFCGSIKQSERLCGNFVYNSTTDDTQLIAFKEEKIDYLGAVDALNEGKNIKNLNNALILKFNSKDLIIKQRIGRVIRFRPGHKGRIIILVAKGTVENKWIRTALKTFDQSRIKSYNVIPQHDRIKTTS